jgi:PadR family transcriptional regulator AphA
MEFIILGLLMGREYTLYEINKALETSISLFYSASFGSISAALDKLERKQWAVVRESVERGRNKRLYALTPAGAEAFSAWLESPIPSEKVRDPALTRLFFLGHLPAAQRITVIEEHLAALELLYASLVLLEQQTTATPMPEARQEIAAYQLLTLRYGKDYYAFSIAWYKRLLIDLKEQSNDRDR